MPQWLVASDITLDCHVASITNCKKSSNDCGMSSSSSGVTAYVVQNNGSFATVLSSIPVKQKADSSKTFATIITFMSFHLQPGHSVQYVIATTIDSGNTVEEVIPNNALRTITNNHIEYTEMAQQGMNTSANEDLVSSHIISIVTSYGNIKVVISFDYRDGYVVECTSYISTNNTYFRRLFLERANS